jgi:hypothetical protein
MNASNQDMGPQKIDKFVPEISRDDIFKVFSFFYCGIAGIAIFQGASNKRSTAQHLHRLGLLASVALSDSSSWKRRR